MGRVMGHVKGHVVEHVEGPVVENVMGHVMGHMKGHKEDHVLHHVDDHLSPTPTPRQKELRQQTKEARQTNLNLKAAEIKANSASLAVPPTAAAAAAAAASSSATPPTCLPAPTPADSALGSGHGGAPGGENDAAPPLPEGADRSPPVASYELPADAGAKQQPQQQPPPLSGDGQGGETAGTAGAVVPPMEGGSGGGHQQVVYAEPEIPEFLPEEDKAILRRQVGHVPHQRCANLGFRV